MIDHAAFKKEFLLREDITFLNMGAFGASPKPVFKKYQDYQLELEQEPVQFFRVSGPKYLAQARAALGAYINCDADDLVYVTNPSYGVNIVAKSFSLTAGDEILTTDIEYGACDRTWKYYCKKAGASYIRQKTNFPVRSKEQFLSEFLAGITPRTKMIFISHITSATGLRLPVEEICKAAKERGIISFVDGAHAPGQIPVDIKALDADIYVGACHKWMMAAKGSSFLYVRRSLQSRFDPLLISWGYEGVSPSSSQFLDYHQLQGTRDYSAFLSVPAAIEYMEKNDWPEVSAACRQIVQENAAGFCELVEAEPLAPLNDDFILQMFSIPFRTNNPDALHDLLFEKYRIQVPVMVQDSRVFIRYSIQAFNSVEDLDRLFFALKEILNNNKS